MTRFYIVNISKVLLFDLYCDDATKVSRECMTRNDFIRTVVGKQLLKYVLMREFHREIRYDEIKIGKYGKPFLEGYPDVYFNISHSYEKVVCAINKCPVGIDIEYMKNIEFRQLADKFFHSNESLFINTEETNAALFRFYKLWTLKESYIKCIGMGLSKQLDSFYIDIGQNDEIIVYDMNDIECSKKYKFYNMQCYNDYQLSICSEYMDIDREGQILDYKCLANYLSINKRH